MPYSAVPVTEAGAPRRRRAAGRRVLCLVGLLLALTSTAPAQTARVRVVIEGVSGTQRDNVMSALSLLAAAREGELTLERIQRLHARAPGEIRLALRPFGHYKPEIDSQLAADGNRWVARYRIELGPVIRVNRLDLLIGGEGRQDQPLRDVLIRFPLSRGDVLRHDLYEAGKTQILSRALDRGYLDATYDTSAIRIDLDSYSAEIVLHLNTGPRFQFGSVIFNQDVLEPAVLAGYVTFRPGDTLSVGRLLDLQSQLSGSPYFSRVEITPRRDLAEGRQVPIQVDLVPRKPQRYEFGFGYGTDTGPRGTFEVEQRRLNRRGHRANGEIRVSVIEQSLAARYLIPSRYPRTEVISFFGGFAHLEPTSSASDKILIGTSLSRERGSWQEVFTVAFEHEAFSVGVDTGTSTLMVAGANWSIARADSRIFPRRGHRVRLGVHGSHDNLLSGATFLQLKAHAKVVQALGPRLRLIGRTELGQIFTNQFRELPPTIRFFAGGDQSVRGFGYRSIGPTATGVDEDSNTREYVIGGEALMVFSAEVDYRLLERWGLALFYDAGNALEEFSFSLEQGVGGGIRWRSPIGLVRVDAAFAVSRSGAPFRLHITVGPDL